MTVSIYSFCLFVEDCHRDHRFDHHAGGRTKARHCLGSERLRRYNIQYDTNPTRPFIPHHHPSPITPAKNLVAPRSAVGLYRTEKKGGGKAKAIPSYYIPTYLASGSCPWKHRPYYFPIFNIHMVETVDNFFLPTPAPPPPPAQNKVG